MSGPATKRRWFSFGLASLFLFVAIVAAGTRWVYCIRHANDKTARAEEVMDMYRADAVLEIDVVVASQEALEADLEVPFRGRRTAIEAHMRRMGDMRQYVELMYPAAGDVRPIVEFTSHYELARRKLAQIAGDEYANSVDGEFGFPYRDQFEGHPAAVRAL